MPITTARGVALYVGALLGPGLLVLPGLAAAEAGPASILAWIGLLFLSGLVAAVFAVLGVKRPSAGGVAGYARLGLGERAGRAVGWCFLAGIVTGAPIVCYLGAGYLAQLLGAGRTLTAVAGGVLLLIVLAITLRGVRTSTAMQLGLVTVLLVVVVVAIGGALPAADARNWTPFAPHGWAAIGSASTVLMMSFVGWEAIAPLTDRFADPRRQLPRVIGTAFAITAVIYLALAGVTVAALGSGAGTEVPMAALLTLGLGPAGPAVAAASALVLTLSTVNAYLTGGAALARSLRGRPGAEFPRWFLLAITGSSAVILALVGAGRLSVGGALTVSTSFFLIVYLGCMISAWRVLGGLPRAISLVAAGAVVVVLAFGGPAILPAALVVVIALLRPSPVGPDAADPDPGPSVRPRTPAGRDGPRSPARTG